MSCWEFPKLSDLILLLVSALEYGSGVSKACLLGELEYSQLALSSKINTIKALRANGTGGRMRKEMNHLENGGLRAEMRC